MEKDTVTIGRITEAKCLEHLTSLGYIVSLPFGGQARYDLLVDVNGKIIKVQVKSSQYKDGCVEFYTASSHYLQGHHVHTVYEKNDIDYFMTELNNQYYLVPVEECGKQKKLRIDSPKSQANITNIHWAKNYIAKEVLEAIE